MIYELSCGVSDQHCSGADRPVNTCRINKLNVSPESARHPELQSCGLGSTCKEPCDRLLGLLDNLASKQRVLDGDLSGPAYEAALHAVWLERRACEEAARVCRSAPLAQHVSKRGMCVALEEFSSAIWELEF